MREHAERTHDSAMHQFASWVTRGFSIAIAFTCLVVVAHCLVNADVYLSSWPRALMHVVLPSFIAGTSIALCLAPAATRMMGLIILVSAGVAIFAAEMYLHWETNPTRLEASRGAQAKVAAARADITAQGRSALPQVCPTMLISRAISGLEVDNGQSLFPLGGIRNNTLVSSINGELDVRRTDRFGFENLDKLWDRPADIVVAGDSFAIGAEVRAGEGFTDKIRATFPATINLGCGGNGPLIELATLVEYGLQARPRVIIWFFYENDVPKNIRAERQYPVLMRYLSGADQSLSGNQVALDHALRDFVKRETSLASAATGRRKPQSRINLKHVFKLERLRGSFLSHFGPFQQADLTLFARVLGKASELAKHAGAQFLFVHLPSERRYINRLSRADHDAASTRLHLMVRSLDIPLIDIAQAFDAHPNPRSLFSGHYTPEGYSLVAETVLKWLVPALRPAK